MPKKIVHSTNQKKNHKKRLNYDPEVIYRAHIHNPYFIKEAKKYSEDKKETENRLGHRDFVILLGDDFERKFPYWKWELPSYENMKKLRNIKADETLNLESGSVVVIPCYDKKADLMERMFNEAEIIKRDDAVNEYKFRDDFNEIIINTNNGKAYVLETDHSLDLFSEEPDAFESSENRFRKKNDIKIGRYLKLYIDLYESTDNIKLKVGELVRTYKDVIGLSLIKERNRVKEQLADFDLYRQKMDASEKGEKPMLPNGKEGERLRRKIDRSCQKVRKIFFDLGLPVD